GAADVELPAHVLDLAPVEGMHPVGAAPRAELDPADVKPRLVRGRAGLIGRDSGGLCPPGLEIDQLHHLAAGERDPLDVKFCHSCPVLWMNCNVLPCIRTVAATLEHLGKRRRWKTLSGRGGRLSRRSRT